MASAHGRLGFVQPKGAVSGPLGPDRLAARLPITTVSSDFSNRKQYTQELRFASDGDGRLDHVVGPFACRQTIRTRSVQQQGAAASGWLLGPAQAGNPALLDGFNQTALIDCRNDSAAALGRLIWQLADGLDLQPGLRLTYDPKAVDYDARVTGGPANPTPAQQAPKDSVLAPQACTRRFGDWNLSGDVTLSWRPRAGLLSYATDAQSFKSAGLDLSGLPNDATGRPALSATLVKPETVDHCEVGLETEPASGTTLNLAAFWTDIRDCQATVVNGQIGLLRGYLADAGRVRVRAVEGELNLRPTDTLPLDASGAWTDARYVRFPDAPCTSASTAARAPASPRTRRRRASPTSAAARCCRCAPATGSRAAGTCSPGCATSPTRAPSTSCRSSRAARAPAGSRSAAAFDRIRGTACQRLRAALGLAANE